MRTPLLVAIPADELRIGGARYVLAQCYEDLGQLQMAIQLLEQVVRMDRKYDLPKLAENVARLERLRARLDAEPPTPQPRESRA